MLYDFIKPSHWLEAHMGANTAPVWAGKTMTSPIYPPQGGFSEVWHIKLSPEIKKLLAQLNHGRRCAPSPYIFQSWCILFDIINMDQWVLCSSQTHSPPKGNISPGNTDVMYADFNTCRVQYHMLWENPILQVWESAEIFKWCSIKLRHTQSAVYVVYASQSMWDYSLWVYLVLLK